MSKYTKMDFHDLLGAMEEGLPDDWMIQIEASSEECNIELINPEGEEVEFCRDDLGSVDTVLEAIKVAQEANRKEQD